MSPPWHAFIGISVLLLPLVSGNLEPVFKQCSSLGSNWATEELVCNKFPAPVAGVAPEQQSICLAAVEIACLNKHREQQCEIGKGAARTGVDCLVAVTTGGEYRKDCCEACKLGLISGSMGMGCTFQNFAFGSPWDKAYKDCCDATMPSTTSPALENTSKGTVIPTPALDSLCDLLPGELCAHICVPIPGSFKCLCREGFTLMADGKSCQQEDLADRCKLNNPCSQKCTDTGIAIECSCHEGFSLAVDERSCIDIDECELGVHFCNLETHECHNQPGSFSCSLKTETGTQPVDEKEDAGKCPIGYQYNAKSYTCDDINECLQKSVCGGNTACQNTIGSYSCVRKPVESCPAGYKFDEHLQSCSDIDECSIGVDTCEEGTFCVNTVGNYTCLPRKDSQCPAGYKYNKVLATCEDVNECEEGTHVCSPLTEECLNEPGGYRCGKRNVTEMSPCQPGFQLNPVTHACNDIDECAENMKPACDSNQECRNTIGSFNCICKRGFELDPVLQACVDLNECQVNMHDCLPSQRCDNTIGSFQCIRFTGCGTGYTLNAQTGLCEDDNECILGTDNCRSLGPAYQCRNTLGSFRCERKRCEDKQILLSSGECKQMECSPGYEPGHSQCMDINECERNSPCRRNQRCLNVPGSYRCLNLLNCPGGFEANEVGTQCLDIDECARGTHDCKRGQQCINSKGGYICQCPPGHTPNQNKECVDVDECTRFAGQICAVNSVCHNTVGSYRCICKDGFRQDPKGGNNCVDIDECSESPGVCQQNCVNMWGSYRCSCNQGFTLQADNRTCQDINECEEFKDRNLCVGICVNEMGSYSCQCPDGYRLGTNGHTCQDIDECLGGNVCQGPNEVCLNTRGGYRCNAIKCPPRFVKDLEHKNRCKRENLYCQDGDTECIKLPASYSFNFITFVSKLSIPPLGYIDLFTMRGPLWSSTNVRFKLEMLDARAPIGISRASRDFFQLRRMAANQAVISLVRSIEGPQEIELQLSMELYHNGVFGGAAVGKLFIFVSQYEF